MNPLGRLTCFLLTGLFLVGCSAQSRLIRGSEKTMVSETLEYYLYFPPEYQTEPDRTFGLLLFLHGGGESGRNLELLITQGPPKRLLEGPDLPYLVLAPQHPYPKKWWNTRAVKQLLDQVVRQHRVDTDRLYLTGLSRGASACWEMAVQYPDTFAAMAVVCGMTPVPYAHWIDPELPIWVFHGTADPVIPFKESEDMVAKLQSLGREVRFTVYEGVGHNAWDRAYATEELYGWFSLFARKSTPGQEEEP
jgi:predicted peptidase